MGQEILLKNWKPRVPPFKVTQGHRNRHGSVIFTYNSYQRSIAAMGLSRTISEINGDFSRKSQIFSHPVYLMPPAEGFPVE